MNIIFNNLLQPRKWKACGIAASFLVVVKGLQYLDLIQGVRGFFIA